MFVLVSIASSMWIGPGASTVQDLIAPRARSIAAAAYLLVVTLIGLALGPYTIGRLSVTLGNLRNAMLVALIVNIPAVVFLLLAARKLPQDEKGMREGNA
jgi:MFS family permease